MTTASASSTTLTHRAQRSDEVLFQQVGDEAVLLDLASEQYFGLDPVGTRIWGLLGQDDHLQQVYDALCREYNAEPARIGSDLLALIDRLAEAGLVKVA